MPVSLGVGPVHLRRHRSPARDGRARHPAGRRGRADAIREQLERRDWTALRDNGNGSRARTAGSPTIGLPPVGSRVTVNRGDGPAGEVTLHDLTQDGRQAAVIWDHQPGTSLVPVGCLRLRPVD